MINYFLPKDEQMGRFVKPSRTGNDAGRYTCILEKAVARKRVMKERKRGRKVSGGGGE